jgi:hypothetical protein
MRSSARAAVFANGREVGVAPEMLVAHAEQVSRDRSLASHPRLTGCCRFTPVPVTSTRWPLRTASSDVIDGEHAVAIVAMHKWAPTLG